MFGEYFDVIPTAYSAKYRQLVSYDAHEIDCLREFLSVRIRWGTQDHVDIRNNAITRFYCNETFEHHGLIYNSLILSLTHKNTNLKKARMAYTTVGYGVCKMYVMYMWQRDRISV